MSLSQAIAVPELKVLYIIIIILKKFYKKSFTKFIVYSKINKIYFVNQTKN